MTIFTPFSQSCGDFIEDDYARHVRRAREMPVEIRLVRRDELHARRTNARLELEEPIDEREAEPPRSRRGLRYELRARGYSPPPPYHLFKVDVAELMFLKPGGDHLVIESWRPGGEVKKVERR